MNDSALYHHEPGERVKQVLYSELNLRQREKILTELMDYLGVAIARVNGATPELGEFVALTLKETFA